MMPDLKKLDLMHPPAGWAVQSKAVVRGLHW
jgi:hypothetical protein